MTPRNVILLGGARNNCGDYLIVARARALFANYLPESTVTVLDRTKPFSSSDFAQMEASDLVVLAGGPLIRNNCADGHHHPSVFHSRETRRGVARTHEIVPYAWARHVYRQFPERGRQMGVRT